ncbi:hypothetical protein LNQ52_18205 [Klebsiella pneumoniae subsp. pneumoniae]|nr:hypothetical protein [Klebsiella pneumoniae subsp. pneumoniae]
MLDNFGRYLLGDSGGGSSSVDEVSILDLKNKAYAAEISRRVLTRLKFPTEAYNHFFDGVSEPWYGVYELAGCQQNA